MSLRNNSEKDYPNSYNMGMLHAKSRRVLKLQAEKSLKKFGISGLDWLLLGLLFENPEGMKLIDIASELGVEAPFVTAMVNKLQKKHFIKRFSILKDRRVKIISLTDYSQKLIPKVDEILRREVGVLFKGINEKEMESYRKVLKILIENYNHINQKGKK